MNSTELQQVYDRITSIKAARESFYEFFRQAWQHFNPGDKLTDGWPIKAQCDHLQATTEGKIKNLVINIGPRSAKSSILSIAFVPWLWITHPSTRFLFGSCNGKLVLDHSDKCRNLILSKWYQLNWGHKFQLSKTQNSKGHFSNDKGGERYAVSMRATNIGVGGDYIILDDPNDPRESSLECEGRIEFYKSVWIHRLNNKETGVRIVAQQRTGCNDITNYVQEYEENVVSLVLPAEYESQRTCHTIPLENDIYSIEMEDGTIKTVPYNTMVLINGIKKKIQEVIVGDDIDV